MIDNPSAGGAMPAPELSHIISAYSMQVVIACGLVENPVTNKREVNLPMAQFHIGILEVLEAKTKGNLTPEEAQFLEQTLHYARMGYLEAKQQGKATAPTDPKPQQ